MSIVLRRVMVVVLAVHGLIHLLGAAKGFGADVAQLEEPIGAAGGALWLLAALLVLTSAGLLAASAPTWWWGVALLGATVSQVAIISSWDDARAGTVVNVVLVVAAGYAFASAGPTSFHAQWRAQSGGALAATDPAPVLVTDEDLAALPEPLAAYIRRSGAVGKPRVTSFEASFHGRIRSSPTEDWMPFTGRQVSTYGARPQRAFIMDATRTGLPVTALHQFAAGTATMRVTLLSLIPVVDAAGPEMDRGETVTVFDDLVVFAPGAIPGAPVRWSAVDPTHVRGVYTDGDQSVSAVLTFDADHDLVDVVSQDRWRACADGRSFVAQPWSTPLTAHRDEGGRRVLSDGAGRWDAPQPEGSFAYLELHVDDIAYNVRDVRAPDAAAEVGPRARVTTTR